MAQWAETIAINSNKQSWSPWNSHEMDLKRFSKVVSDIHMPMHTYEYMLCF